MVDTSPGSTYIRGIPTRTAQEHIMLKLGTQTGSLVNHLVSGNSNTDPVVGMGATELCWSDRHACTVFRVWRKGQYIYIEVRSDKATRTDKNGMSDSQEYVYTTQVNGGRSYYRRPVTGGAWERTRQNTETGRWIKCGGGLWLGTRNEHHDFSF